MLVNIKENQITVEKKILPVSVKTRIGFGKVVTEEWIRIYSKLNQQT